jgi:phosphoenolpyruvate synthase/pyruvate phosphate dikinase
VTPRFTCGTADLGAADAGRAGGKAAALGELSRAGLPLPRGYVVTVAAFGLHLDVADPSGAASRVLGSLPADDLAGIASAAAGMRARMLSPRSAGVMFTRSPVTGDRSVVAIEATWGLGSALVSGEVTPDSFTVSKVTGEITGRRALLGDSPGHPALHADLADRIVLLQSRPETVWAARDRVPIASPRAKPSDHVLARFRRAL